MPVERTSGQTLLRRGFRLAAGALFALFALYVGMQVVLALRSNTRTETAITYTLAESITLNGVAVFDSTPVTGSGSLGYLVADGERVTAGTELAEQYTNEEQGVLRERLDRLQSSISLLERSQAAAGSDLTQLNTQTQLAVYALLDELDSGVYSGADAAGDEFLLAQNRLQVRTGQSTGFESQLQDLRAQAQQIEGQLAMLDRIRAQTNGYFVSADAAAGLTVDYEVLNELTPAELATLLHSGVPASGGQTVGYIVGGFSWWFFATCTPEEAQRLKGLSAVKISVPGKLNEPQSATVQRLTVDEENGVATLVLSCETINANVLRLGQESARIDLHTYTGIRIDRDAIHIVNGERGVYVNYGGITRFRRITVLYENDKTILVPAGGAVGTENEVRLYDQIIVEGNNLRDKKLL